MADKINDVAHGKPYAGITCPHCNSDNISGGSIEIEPKSASQECSCGECGSTWVDEYVLKGYSNLEAPASESDEDDEPDTRVTIMAETGRATFVRTPEANSFEVLWDIELNLSDRWGDLNFEKRVLKPSLSILERDTQLHESIRSMMFDEATFIARFNGEFGVLFEQEFCTRESEGADRGNAEAYRPEAEVIERIAAVTRELASQFQHVSFAVPNTDLVYDGRVALWAFVALKDRDVVDIEALGKAIYDKAYGKRAGEA